MTCARCGSNARPSIAVGADMQLREACSACGETFVSTRADPVLQLVDSSDAQSAKPTLPRQPQTVDVLSLAKTRLTQLEAELEAMSAKQREADMLRRMIAAATN